MNVSLFVKDLLAPDEFGDCDFDGYDAMVYLVDFYKNALIQPNLEVNKLKYTADGLHPNAKGHVLMAERIGNFLLSY